MESLMLKLNFGTFAILLLFTSSVACAQSSPSTSSPQPPIAGQTVGTAALPIHPEDSKSLVILRRQKPDYPLVAEREGIQGQVIVLVQISETGDVESAEVVSGVPELTDAALHAAKKFKFEPYLRDGKPIKVKTKLPFNFYFEGNMTTQDPYADSTSKLARHNSSTAPAPLPASPPAPDSKSDSSAPAPELASAPPKTVSISAGVSQGLLIRKVAPVYPPKAKHNGIQGTVVLKAIIGKDGRIKDLRAVSGPGQLCAAAIGAVQQWQYRPYLLFGEPVEVDTQVTVNFQLR
jgi:TonB family protein